MGLANRKKSDPTSLGGLDSSQVRSVRPVDETRVLRATIELRRRLQDAGDVEKAVKSAARFGATLFHADEWCIGVDVPGETAADIIAGDSNHQNWDGRLLLQFIRGEKPDVPDDTALARLRRRRRSWGVLALRWRRGSASWEVRDGLRMFAQELNRIIEERDYERVREVRSRIDRKIMEQLRSEDLFYQILDGLRSLTRYDHSATLLVQRSDANDFEVAAEKLAWRRGKSKRVGTVTTLSDAEFENLSNAGVCGCSVTNGQWSMWETQRPLRWLDTLAKVSPVAANKESPKAREAIIIPLATREHLKAVLIISAVEIGAFGSYEVDLLSSFVPYMAIALQNTQRTEALEARIIDTERKHAMAELARGVAHDVNNALGGIVPLVEQMRADVEVGQLNGDTLRGDLEVIDQSVQTCRRIFGGMLRFARDDQKPLGYSSFAAALETSLSILGEGLRRCGIEIVTSVDDEKVSLNIPQAQFERVLMNVLSNARDAMPNGGRLTIGAALKFEDAIITIQDTGAGISAEQLALVMEPFYTTKPGGTGLGLAICRSIIWQCGGKLRVDSEVGEGTIITIQLPRVSPEATS